jgi:hypothetical protein
MPGYEIARANSLFLHVHVPNWGISHHEAHEDHETRLLELDLMGEAEGQWAATPRGEGGKHEDHEGKKGVFANKPHAFVIVSEALAKSNDLSK